MTGEERVEWAEAAENDPNPDIRLSAIRSRAFLATMRPMIPPKKSCPSCSCNSE